MKFMETINEIQALFTKLRREAQRSEAGTTGIKPLEPCHNYLHRINKAIIDSAGYPSPEILDEIAELRRKLGKCVCGHSLSDCPICKRQKADVKTATETGTAGECTCSLKGVKKDELLAAMIDPCPVHGTAGDSIREVERDMEKLEDEIDNIPDFSLHVRVARVLGYHIFQLTPNDSNDKHWSMSYYENNNEEVRFIPDYPNDLVAAMGALEEHCKKHNWYYEFLCFPDHPHRYSCTIKRYRCDVNESVDNDAVVECTRADTLPQAICEAIVAHSEAEC